MRCILVDETAGTGPEALKLGERPEPSIEPNEVLLRVMATAVNRADTLQRKGGYAPPKGASDILGLEAAGVIERMGEQAKEEGRFKVGDKVMALLSGTLYSPRAACMLARDPLAHCPL